MKKVVKHYSEKDARDFFARFAAYSAEVVRVRYRDEYRSWPTRNRYDEERWAYGGPIGHVLHWTGGTSFRTALRHFTVGGRVAPHWLIGKRRDRANDELRQRFGLDLDLRSETLQIVGSECPAPHCGWANRFCVGTEHRNAGLLRPYPKDPPRGVPRVPPREDRIRREEFFRFADLEVEDLDFYWWAEDWTARFRGEVLKLGGLWWESWSRAQLADNVTILRYLTSLRDLDPTWMFAHHNVNRHKSDVVMPVPLDHFRDSVLYDRRHVDDLEWLAGFDDVEGDEDGGPAGVEFDDPWMLSQLDVRGSDRAEEDLEDFDPTDRDGSAGVAWASEALARMGYYVPHGDEDRLHAAVRIYQRSREITVDGVVGPQTRAALMKDLRSWRVEV